ncbi:hypothetical protein JCM18899A_13900 [Nocardioides sp. AN3]
MSLLADRQAIADAASTVAGVTCTPQYRLSLNPGDACVRLTVANRAANGFGFVNTWQVWVALSQDLATAEAWLDGHLNELAAALDPVLFVSSLTPSELVLAGGAVTNGVVVEGQRAA